VWQLPGVVVIDVADMEALVRIAEHYDRSILYEADDEGEAFWVTDESGQFRYAVGAPAWRVDGDVIEELPRELRIGDVYADELEPGGEISVFETQPAAAAVAADSAAAEDWAAYDAPAYGAADAITQDWHAIGAAADVGRTPAIAAFAPITGLEWTSDS
jgi:hypothetical protein